MTHSPLRNDADPDWRAMHLAAQAEEASLAQALRLAFAALLGRVALLRLRQALQAGDIESAMQAVPVGQLLLVRPLIEAALARTAAAGARIAQASAIVRLGPGSIAQAEVAFWARTRSAGLVVGVTEQTRQALRKAIAESLTASLSRAELARRVEVIVGLSKPQVAALLNRADELVERGLAVTKRQAILERYAAQLRRQRAQVIARHELMQAANEGRRLQWEREARDGLIAPDRWEREWVAVMHDNRTCPYCIDADGTRAPLNGVYPNGSDGPPGHVICRCTENLVRRSA